MTSYSQFLQDKIERRTHIERKTKFVTPDIIGVSGFTELVLTTSEADKLKRLKSLLVDLRVEFLPDAHNRTDHIGIITDIRIVVAAHDKICPCAIVNFPSREYSRLRGLDGLVLTNDLAAIIKPTLLIFTGN